MHGNVVEWCADRDREMTYAASVTDPLIIDSDRSGFVKRGGLFGAPALYARSDVRGGGTHDQLGDGFRVARTYP